MRNLLLPCSRRFSTRIYALSGILATMLLLTGTAAAQVEPLEKGPVEEKDNRNMRIGVYVSGYGLLNNFYCDHSVYTYCVETMPYPIIHTSVSYNSYQIISFLSKDENESIFNLTGRYNYHPLKKYRFRVFGFTGLSVWHFNRRWAYRTHNENSPEFIDCKYGCFFNNNVIRYESITDPEFTYELRIDRPYGRSTMLGLNVGLGIEYNILALVFTHEMNWYFSNCSYKEYVCTVRDFKFLGLHLSF